MNSLRRPRRRPRVRSLYFRSFEYVLMREAFLEQLNVAQTKRVDSHLRYELMRVDNESVRTRFDNLLRMQGHPSYPR